MVRNLDRALTQLLVELRPQLASVTKELVQAAYLPDDVVGHHLPF
jgi:hypothetical protein